MLTTNTGQAAGILFRQWVPYAQSGVLRKGFHGVVSKILDAQSLIQRILLICGKPVDEATKLCIDFSGNTVEKVYKPEFFCLDITFMIDDDCMTLTAVQTDKKSTWMNKRKIGQDWKAFVSLSEKMFLEEFLGKCIGRIRPSWGMEISDRLYLGQTDVCLGTIRTPVQFPRQYDGFDLGRLEKILIEEGVDAGEGVDLDEIQQRIARTQ